MKVNALLLTVLLGLGLQACAESIDEPDLETSSQRLSYGLAYLTGKDLIAKGMPIDPDAYAAGIRDAAANVSPKLTEEEIRSEMLAFQDRIRSIQESKNEMTAKNNRIEGEEFLKTNSAREDVSVTSSGLQYKILRSGDGATPTAEDSVEVHYRGTLLDGTVFDSSYDRGKTVNFGVTQVISGWTEALQLMSVGAKWKLYIPSDLAYGAGGAGGLIGPNETLIFEVELVSIVNTTSE